MYNLIPSINNIETPTIPTTPKIHPNEVFKITKNTQANNIIVATSFQILNANEEYLSIVAEENPTVIAHNIETVSKLSRKIRPQGSYGTTLKVFNYLSSKYPQIILKSGLMIGFGETLKDIEKTLIDLKKEC